MRKELNEIEDSAYVLNLEMLSELYCNRGDIEKGIAFCKEAVEMQKRMYGQIHPLYARVLEHLGKLYTTANKYENAFKCTPKSSRN